MNIEEELEFRIELKQKLVHLLESEINEHQERLDDLRIDKYEDICED